MRKTYETSTKAKQWARHLKPWGKAVANRSTRRLGRQAAKKVVAHPGD